MAATDVIFRIGTLGVSKAQLEIGAVVAALYKVGQAIADQIEKADEFSDVWSNLSEKQKTAVSAMDKATKGFISTLDGAKTAGKLAAAGIEPTNAQMEALGKITTKTALSLGEGPEGAKTRLDALTDSLIKGNSRGLKPYGIELESTGSLSEKQAEAFSKLEQRANGLNIELEGLDDKWAALGNTVSTSRGLVYDWIAGSTTAGKVIDSLTQNISGFNDAIVKSDGTVLDWLVSLDGISSIYGEIANNIAQSTLEMLNFGGVFDNLISKYDTAIAARKKERVDQIKNLMKKKAGPTYEDYGQSDWEQSSEMFGETWSPDYQEPIGEYVTGESVKKKKKGKGIGGVGGKKETKKPADITEDLISNFGVEDRKKFVDDLFEKLPEIERAQNSINQLLYEQVNSMGTLVSAEDERLRLLEEKRDIDLESLTVDEKHELWKAEEEHAQAMIKYEEERNVFLGKNIKKQEEAIDVSNNFKVAGERLGDALTASMMASNEAFITLAKSMVNGSKMGAKAFGQMISKMLWAIALQFEVLAVSEFAQAIISAAKKEYDAAAEHAAAGAMCIVVAAAASAGAIAVDGSLGNNIGGGGSNAKGSSGGGTTSYGGGESSGNYSGESSAEVIEIKVDGSLANLFAQLQIEAKRQKKAGY